MRRTATLLVTLCLACGATSGRTEAESPRSEAGPMPPTGPDPRVVALEASVQALTARVSLLEQRLGLQPFRPSSLSVPPAGLALEATPVGQWVEAPGSAPRKVKASTLVGAGRPTVVTFWATWCKPCTSEEELTRLKALQGQLRAVGADLVSVAVDGLDKVRSHPRAAAWLYPFVSIDNGHLEMLPKALIDRIGVGLPLFLVVGPDGQVRWHRASALDATAQLELVTAAVNAR